MLTEGFQFEALPGRVVFGRGTVAQAAEESRRLGAARAFVVCSAEQRETGEMVLGHLGAFGAAIFPGAVMHTPTDVSEIAAKAARDAQADLIVSVGGGSATGLGKAITLRTDIPLLAIPTTYAGSEATPILGQSENNLKTTLRTMKILPKAIIYDVDLTLDLPVSLSVTSGINAMAHAVEALYAKERNPVTSIMAETGIGALARALPVIVRDPANHEARAEALYGAWLCGICLGTAGMSLHHKICHTLGGTFGLPHAPTHCVVLPHAIAYNSAAAPEAIGRVAKALGVKHAASGLFDLLIDLKAPTSLREIGLNESDLDRATDLAVSAPYWNPRPIERPAIRQMLQDAYDGARPA